MLTTAIKKQKVNHTKVDSDIGISDFLIRQENLFQSQLHHLLRKCKSKDINPISDNNQHSSVHLDGVQQKKWTEAQVQYKGLHDALILANQWSTQKHLVDIGLSNNSLSQLLIWMCSEDKAASATTSPKAKPSFKSTLYKCSLLDSEWLIFKKLLNLLARQPLPLEVNDDMDFLCTMSLTDVDEIRYEAQLTLQQMEQDQLKSLETLFSSTYRKTLFHKWDLMVCITCDNDIKKALNFPTNWMDKTQCKLASSATTQSEVIRFSFPTLIRRALNARVKLVNARMLRNEQGQPTNKVMLGLILDAEKSRNLVDQGPIPNEARINGMTNSSTTTKLGPDAWKTIQSPAEFQAIWGAKAELRRFKNGSILESVVWETTDADKKTDNLHTNVLDSRQFIPERMIHYLVERHLRVKHVKCLSAYHIMRHVDAYLFDNDAAFTKSTTSFPKTTTRFSTIMDQFHSFCLRSVVAEPSLARGELDSER